MNFIFFNGPPRSGKDTAAKIAFDFIGKDFDHIAVWEKFSFPNKRGFAGIVDHNIDAWGNVDTFEAAKEEVISFLGVSYRQFQIDISEKFMKPLYGIDIFGRLLLQRCHEYSSHSPFNPIFIVSDCGFQIEVDTLKDHNVLLFILHREGCDFTNDSREFVKGHPNWTTIMHNNVTLDGLKLCVQNEVQEWLGDI